jgi:hypothetical protein
MSSISVSDDVKAVLAAAKSRSPLIIDYLGSEQALLRRDVGRSCGHGV